MPTARHLITNGLRRLACLAVGFQVSTAGVCAEPPQTAGDPPLAVAIVTDLTGTAQVRHARTRRALAVLDAITPGDELQLDAAAAVEVAFTAGAGSVLQLAGPGRFLVQSDTVLARGPGARVARRDLAAAWRGLRIRPGMVGRASIALRGPPANEVPLRAPRGGQDGAHLQWLQWDPPYGHPADDWDYTVRVIDDDGVLLFIAQSQERRVKLPDGLAFERGRDYLWTVHAHAPGTRLAYGAAEFHRIAADAEAAVQTLTQSAIALRRQPDQPESSAEEVLLALAMEQCGLGEQAKAQWHALTALRPSLAGLPAP